MINIFKLLFLSTLIASCSYSYFVPKSHLIKELNGYLFELNEELFLISIESHDDFLNGKRKFEIYNIKFDTSNEIKNLIKNSPDTLPVNNLTGFINEQNLQVVFVKIRFWDEVKTRFNQNQLFGFNKEIKVKTVSGEIISLTPIPVNNY